MDIPLFFPGHFMLLVYIQIATLLRENLQYSEDDIPTRRVLSFKTFCTVYFKIKMLGKYQLSALWNPLIPNYLIIPSLYEDFCVRKVKITLIIFFPPHI